MPIPRTEDEIRRASEAMREFMKRDFGRWQHKVRHPMAFTPDNATAYGAINLVKGADGVWR